MTNEACRLTDAVEGSPHIPVSSGVFGLLDEPDLNVVDRQDVQVGERLALDCVPFKFHNGSLPKTFDLSSPSRNSLLDGHGLFGLPLSFFPLEATD